MCARRTTGPTWPIPPGSTPDSVTCLTALDASEITRVLRARDHLGTRNLHPDRPLTGRDITDAKKQTLARLLEAQTRGLSDAKRYREALGRVQDAGHALSDDARRATAKDDARSHARPMTFARTGPVDLDGLRTFIASPTAREPRLDKNGQPTGKTLGQVAQKKSEGSKPLWHSPLAAQFAFEGHGEQV